MDAVYDIRRPNREISGQKDVVGGRIVNERTQYRTRNRQRKNCDKDSERVACSHTKKEKIQLYLQVKKGGRQLVQLDKTNALAVQSNRLPNVKRVSFMRRYPFLL